MNKGENDMFQKLTIKQKIVIGFLLPLIILLINTLTAYMQIGNYHRVMEYEITQIEDSNHMKSDLGKLLDTSDRIAGTAGLSVISISMISIIMVVLLVVFLVRSIQIENQGDKGEGGV
jgi:small-conductance mechanosensitive channel